MLQRILRLRVARLQWALSIWLRADPAGRYLELPRCPLASLRRRRRGSPSRPAGSRLSGTLCGPPPRPERPHTSSDPADPRSQERRPARTVRSDPLAQPSDGAVRADARACRARSFKLACVRLTARRLGSCRARRNAQEAPCRSQGCWSSAVQ